MKKGGKLDHWLCGLVLCGLTILTGNPAFPAVLVLFYLTGSLLFFAATGMLSAGKALIRHARARVAVRQQDRYPETPRIEVPPATRQQLLWDARRNLDEDLSFAGTESDPDTRQSIADEAYDTYRERVRDIVRGS